MLHNDPIINAALQFHMLLIDDYLEKELPVTNPDSTELATFQKVEHLIINGDFSNCFDEKGNPIHYPKFTTKICLVAIVTVAKVKKVFIVYSLEQMMRLKQQFDAGNIEKLEWKYLRTPKLSTPFDEPTYPPNVTSRL